MVLPRLKPPPYAPATEEFTSRVGPLRSLGAGLAGIGRGISRGLADLGGGPGSVSGLFAALQGPGYMSPRERRYEDDFASMFMDDPLTPDVDETNAEMLKLGRVIGPRLAMQEHLKRQSLSDERDFTRERDERAFSQQERLLQERFRLEQEGQRSRLTGEPFEAYVGGELRPIMRDGAGGFFDHITGEPIDRDMITFDKPSDPKTTLESMSPEGRTRVLFSGPNAIEAARTLTGLYEGGYSPTADFGAAMLRDAPLLLGGDAMARIVGGSDYQQAEQAWRQFEAGMLPILSGAAVTDSEAKRVLNAMKPAVGDSRETIARKVAAINRMSAIAEQAIGGQPVTDLSSIVELQPLLNQQGGAEEGEESIDDLINRYAR